MRSDLDQQRQFFDDATHQYPPTSVIAPPLHTTLELRSVVDAIADVPLGQVVIDFGAGTGRLTVALARAGYDVLAVDISEPSLSVLDGVARTLGLGGIHTTTSLPNRGMFGAIVGSDVLHHVDLDDVLPRLRLLLADGGRIAFSEPGGMNPTWYAWAVATGCLRVERRIAACNLRTLSRALRRHGFREVSITGVGLLPRPFAGRNEATCRANDRSGNLPLLRWLAYRYLIKARS